MKNLYIDFDGVILDTISVGYKMLEELGIDLKDDPQVSNFWRVLDWNDFLTKTPVINDGINAIKKIIATNEYDVAILTHIHSLEEAEAKVKFIRKHLSDITIILVPKTIPKTKIVNAKNAILIDDYAGNLRQWKEAGGFGVRFSLKGNGKGFPVIDHLDQILDIEVELS